MSESAYSEELNREISAIEAQKKSVDGILKNEKAFHCADPSCGIRLTCSNWTVENAKRIFFTPSNRNELHSTACSTVTHDQEIHRIEIETKQGKRTIVSKNGIIDMKKSVATAISNPSGQNNNTNINAKLTTKRNTVTTDKKDTETRNISSIKTYINFYYDDEIDNDVCNIKVDGNLISLNTLFVDATQEIQNGVNRIFMGRALVKTPKFNDKLVSFEFVNTDKPIVYANKGMLLTRINSELLNKYLDTEKECQFFFRGSISDNGSFTSFNGKNYCDIYIKDIE